MPAVNTACYLNIPYPRWAQASTPDPQESFENWSKVEQWAKDFLLNNCIGVNPTSSTPRTTSVPNRCQLYIPYKTAYLDGPEIEENWLAIERWVVDILLNYNDCFECGGVLE